ncbi:hypothetical protein ACQR0Z_19165 [Bradyrhizobium sp. HKCCYLS3077]|uniref:hypothetical protein n=1 Tax=Bradyrhizobium sp. HKCCYLS3077 TaxID=3420761 RepID=UPI003EB854D1
MTVKSEHMLHILEQTVDDPVAGFTFKFLLAEGAENPSRLLFKKSADTVWREYSFDTDGEFAGATSRISAANQPSSLRLVK